jgi:proteic killer suppression protein
MQVIGGGVSSAKRRLIFEHGGASSAGKSLDPRHGRRSAAIALIGADLHRYTPQVYTLDVINRVELSAGAKKDLRTVPPPVLKKFRAWIDDVEFNGLEEARKRPGYHDEPLKGDRRGQRSVRLNRSWRAIYEIKSDGSVEFVEVKEVNHHDY